MIDFGSAPGPHGIGCVGPDSLTFCFFDLFFGRLSHPAFPNFNLKLFLYLYILNTEYSG